MLFGRPVKSRLEDSLLNLFSAGLASVAIAFYVLGVRLVFCSRLLPGKREMSKLLLSIPWATSDLQSTLSTSKQTDMVLMVRMIRVLRSAMRGVALSIRRLRLGS